MSDLFRNVQVEMSDPPAILTSIKIEKEVNLLTKGVLMNSLLVPADSLKATLHFPNRNGDCFYCNETITFVAGLNRYVGNDGIRCSKAGN